MTTIGDRTTSSGAAFIKERKTAVALLVPENVETYTSTMRREEAATLPGNSVSSTELAWSCLVLYRANTEAEIAPLVPRLVAAIDDYGQLATSLMIRLATQLVSTPYAFAHDDGYRQEHKASGYLDNWHYFFHGCDCEFENTKTWQKVQARQSANNATGFGFGVFDPMFLAQFCSSTPAHKALARSIRHDPADWERAANYLAKQGYLQSVLTDMGTLVLVRTSVAVPADTTQESSL